MELNENLSVPFHCFYTWLPLDVGVGGEDGGGIIQIARLFQTLIISHNLLASSPLVLKV